MKRTTALRVAVYIFGLAFINSLFTLLAKKLMSPSMYGAFDASWWVMMVAGVGFFIYARFYAK